MTNDAPHRAWRRASNLRHLTEARDLLRRHGFARVDDHLGGDEGWAWRPAHPTLQREPRRVLCLHESEPHAWEGVAVQDTEDALAQVRRSCEQVREGTHDLGAYETAEVVAWLWWAEGASRCADAEAWVSRWAERLRDELRRRGARRV